MNDLDFTAAKQRLDVEIDKLGSNPQVGILMGIDLYTEFRSRSLLKDAVADLVHWKVTLQGYRGLFVSENGALPREGFRIGT